ncbi:MAG: ketopantoate reductase family protein [Gammaproteobacteria bacterium]|nr:ketopantoate reductase family protein [Gammaproteobacteria bacterium]
MRFIIYGAGGIGGTIGARLHLTGHDVLLIARGAHLDALRTDGMRFITATRDERLRIPAVGHPREADIGDDDVVLLCVKGQQTEDALRVLYDVAGDDVPVVCAQNGVVNERIALRRFRRVYGMVVYLPGEHMEPGEIVNTAEDPAGILDVGCYPSGLDDTAVAVARAITDAGCSALPDPAIMRWKYAKLLANVGNALQAACETMTGEIMRMLRNEALACYEAADIDCATVEETRARRATGIRMAPVPGRARHGGSSWQSIRRGTGNIEADYLNGEIVQLGRLHGVPTPGNLVMQHIGNRLAREGLPVGSYTVEELTELIEKERERAERADGAATP